jgi:pimeloyl-ACP methyl ester carboxylesterase
MNEQAIEPRASLFMIHGMWGAGWHWDKYREFFQERGFSSVAPTLRYHGGDPQAPPDDKLGTTSLLDYAEDLERALRSLDEPPIIMGHSMGGLLAQILGSRGLARALVLLTPAPPCGIMALTPSVANSFLSIMVQWGFWKKAVRQTFGEAVYSIMHRLTPQEQHDAYQRFGYESGRAVFEIGLWPLDGRRASFVDEKKVRCPVLVISGGQDRITPSRVVRKIAAKYGPLATFMEFPDHAHWVLGEPGWEEIASFITRWLDKPLLPDGGDGLQMSKY